MNPLDVHFARSSPLTLGLPSPRSPLVQSEFPGHDDGDSGSLFGDKTADNVVDDLLASIEQKEKDEREAKERERELERKRVMERLEKERSERQKLTESPLRAAQSPLPHRRDRHYRAAPRQRAPPRCEQTWLFPGLSIEITTGRDQRVRACAPAQMAPRAGLSSGELLNKDPPVPAGCPGRTALRCSEETWLMNPGRCPGSGGWSRLTGLKERHRRIRCHPGSIPDSRNLFGSATRPGSPRVSARAEWGGYHSSPPQEPVGAAPFPKTMH